jgi:hypothetical protein
LVGSCLVLILACGMTSCARSSATTIAPAVEKAAIDPLATTDGPLSEVNIPNAIAKLAPTLEKYHPQVQILSPQADEILSDDRVTVKLKVNNLPLFKQPELGLGNHLHVILDKQTYQGVYDLTQPLVFKNLTPGTHSLRVFASRPWHESFKNDGAYAQTTFHVLTKTAENNPNPQQPLLTYSRPTGTYGAEPIMLDYYLTNIPSHLVAKQRDNSLTDWRIRVTVNGQQFILGGETSAKEYSWAPIYLQGFKPGKNWVRLELIDDRGTPIPNVYNDTMAIVTYDPQTKDSLAKLIRGELNPDLAMTLVAPNYIEPKLTPPPIPQLTPAPTVIPAPIILTPPAIAPAPTVPQTSPSPMAIAKNIPTVLPSPIPSPVIPSPKVISTPKSTPGAMPAPTAANIPQPIEAPQSTIAKPNPEPTIAKPSPVVVVTPKPEPIAKPISPSSSPSPIVSPVATPTPIVTTVKSTPVEHKAWQTQAIESFKNAGVKTREFTNSIPPKVERFTHNVQNWVGKALDTTVAKVRAWRDSTSRSTESSNKNSG